MKKLLLILTIFATGQTLKAQQSVPDKPIVISIDSDSLYQHETLKLENELARQEATIIELQKQISQMWQRINQVEQRSIQTNYGKKPVIDRRGSKQIVYK